MGANHSSMETTCPQKQENISLNKHPYYGPLIDSYVRNILESGLLLDEDLEVLLSTYHFETIPEQNRYKISFALITGISSILGSLFLTSKFHSRALIIPVVLMSSHIFYSEFRNLRMRKQNKEVIKELIDKLNKIHRTNVKVNRYLKTRIELGKSNQEEMFTVYNKSTNDFSHFFMKNKHDCFQTIFSYLNLISSQSPELSEDFQFIKDLNVPQIINNREVNDINDLIEFTSKIHDLHILCTSKLLSYIGTLLSSKKRYLSLKNLHALLNVSLPTLIKKLETHCNDYQRAFDSLRHLVNKRTEFRSQKNVPSSSRISTKLEDSLLCSINNLSIILEKSQLVLQRLECGKENNFEEVGNAIVDLKNHTFATYESLDLLSKLYGILSNYDSTHKETKQIDTIKPEHKVEKSLATIKFDDSNEPIEERYELYVDAENQIEKPDTSNYEDNSGAYLSLMLQELRQSLKQHQRFIDAKHRRGSVEDEEATESVLRKKIKSPPPRFNLEAINMVTEKENAAETTDKAMEISAPLPFPSPLSSPLAPPAPPTPPILPSFNLADLEKETGQGQTQRSLLDNIRTLSSQRNVQEDVFGDSDIDSSSSTD